MTTDEGASLGGRGRRRRGRSRQGVRAASDGGQGTRADQGVPPAPRTGIAHADPGGVLPLGIAAIGWLALLVMVLADGLGAGVSRVAFGAAGCLLAIGLWLHVLASPSRAPSSLLERTPLRDHLAPMAVPALAALVAFGWALRLGPFSDDFVLRGWATSGQWIPRTWPYVRPVPLALWQALFALGGGWTTVHAVNLVFHATNSALVGLVGSLVLGRRSGLAAGLVFAMFPASAEPVAWPSGVFETLGTSCVLTAIVVWLRAENPRLRGAAVVLLFSVALLSKESAIVLPGLLILASAAWQRSTLIRRDRLSTVALAGALAVAYVVARASASPVVSTYVRSSPPVRYLAQELLLRPFTGLALPLRADTGPGGDTHLVAASVVLLVGVTLSSVVRPPRSEGPTCRRAARTVLFALAWVLVCSLPPLQHFEVHPDLQGSRYLYLPCVGFALLLSTAFACGGAARQTAAAAILGVLLAAYGNRLVEERQIWFEAAGVRDSLLGQATALAGSRPCRSVFASGAADNWRGVYVFRNGREVPLSELPLDPAGQPCSLEWAIPSPTAP